jgi:hypothetical protein
MRMSLRRSAIGVSLALLVAACDEKIPPYPPLEGITRVDVRVRLAGRDATVTSIVDPDSVARVMAFVNVRRNGWQRPWYGIPVPVVVAEFYRGKEFMGHVGSGASFMEAQRQGDFASRPASAEEVAVFNALLGVGTKVIAVPPKRP